MSTRIAVVLAILLSVGLAPAQSTPDPAAAKVLERQAMQLRADRPSAPTAPAAYTITGALDTSSPTYNRIFTSSVDPACGAVSADSTVGNGVYYQVFQLGVTANEMLELSLDGSATSINDPVLSVYCDPFDPADPMANLIAYSDDVTSGNLLPGFDATDNVALSPGVSYWLVLSTFAPGDQGTFQIDVTSATAFDVPVELQSFSVE